MMSQIKMVRKLGFEETETGFDFSAIVNIPDAS